MHHIIINSNLGKAVNLSILVLLILVLTYSSCLFAEEVGFRPGDDQETIDQFVHEFESHIILCFPVIYRSREFYYTLERTEEYLPEYFSGWDYYPDLEFHPDAPDFSETISRTQWAVFETNMSIFAEFLSNIENSWDYAIAFEILMTNTPSGGQATGGIQCYILNNKGEDIFSFLLNSHHDLFNDANLYINSTDSSEVAKLAVESLYTVLQALRIQIEEQ